MSFFFYILKHIYMPENFIFELLNLLKDALEFEKNKNN